MKIAFLGTSAFAVPALAALVEAGHDVACVYTRAPKPAGRGQQERKTPVHELADRLGLPVRTPRTLKSDQEAEAFKALDLDAAVVVSYGHILPKSFLDAPVLGCLNIIWIDSAVSFDVATRRYLPLLRQAATRIEAAYMESVAI